MGLLTSIKSGLQKRKVKIFLVFLTCSFLISLVSKLSETYTDDTRFDLAYTNAPDTLLLTQISKEDIAVRLRARGFQFLGFNFRSKQVTINLTDLKHRRSRYFVPPRVYREQIEKQLPGTINLLDIDQDTLFFDFQKMYRKRVPVRVNTTLELGQNHLLDGEVGVQPDSITLLGPQVELDKLEEVLTYKSVWTGITEDFDRLVALQKPEGIEHTTFSANSVRLSGKVFRFSEKVIEVPVTVANLPEGTEIKTFPNTLPVLCKARIDRLKGINPTDFSLVADYTSTAEGETHMEVKLLEKPEEVHTAKLLETRVEFILKRE